MKNSRLLATAALAACLGVPAIANAQFNNGAPGSSGYGIFGGGTNGVSGQFGRGSFSQGSFGQGLGTAGGIGRTSAVGLGASPTVSPYLNLLRPGNAAVNYMSLVRPQIQQNAINTQYNNNFQQTDRLLLEQQRQTRQMIDPGLANADFQTDSRRPVPVAQSQARPRTAEPADSELRDWANPTKSPDAGSGNSREARRREANLRQQQELKALEKELAASADNSKAAGNTGAPPDRVPGTPYGYRPINHYFPSQGGVNRLGGNR
jgi:hypothetical protein